MLKTLSPAVKITIFLNLLALITVTTILVLWRQAKAAPGNQPLATNNQTPIPTPTSGVQAVHHHANLKMYLNNQPLDLSTDKYKSTSTDFRDPHLHLHDNVGDVLHIHQAPTTIADFLKTLGFTLTDTCLTLDDTTSYCTDDKNALVVYVNGNQVIKPAPPEYIIKDLDRILITHGPLTQLTADLLSKQYNSVPDTACIYSETCPERGTPPAETCVASAETPCVIEK